MLILARPSDLLAHKGRRLGTSEWLTVDQTIIDMFARATNDHNWIHVDTERAKQELPGGVTIAHGFLTLALLPRMTDTIFKIANYSKSLNYGANRVRFTGAVPSASRICLLLDLKDVTAVDGAARATFGNTVEVESVEKPVLFAETIYQYYD